MIEDFGVALNTKTGPGIELDAETESVMDGVGVDEVLVDECVGIDEVLVDEIDTPIVGARKIRFSLLQHSSGVRLPPQHHLPSVAHCVMATLSSDVPPNCFSSVPSTSAR